MESNIVIGFHAIKNDFGSKLSSDTEIDIYFKGALAKVYTMYVNSATVMWSLISQLMAACKSIQANPLDELSHSWIPPVEDTQQQHDEKKDDSGMPLSIRGTKNIIFVN